MNVRDEKINLIDIINKELVVTHFQPLVSIKKKLIVGFEALSRGKHPEDYSLIPPDLLFRLAAQEGLTLQLDRLCRKIAIENFNYLYQLDDNYILSINIDPTILNEDIVGSNHLIDLATSANINPGRILLEILESEIGNVKSLMKFVDTYRGKGFLLALDDIGAGLSNLDRIALIKPDILKIDKSLISKIHREYHSKEIIRSIVTLAHRIGSLVIAEGIETEDDVHSLLELDIDILQGFYFAKPSENVIHRIETIQEKITSIAKNFKESSMKNIIKKNKLLQEYNKVIDDFIFKLSNHHNQEFNSVLEALVRSNPNIECAYLLDEFGMQISDTIFHPTRIPNPRNSLFQPGILGTDQSLKDYCFFVSGGMPKYTTEPYISLASGNMCITISVAFMNKNGRKCILCLDLIHDSI